MNKLKDTGVLLTALLLFLSLLLAPLPLESGQQRFLAVFVLTVILWLASSIPLFVSGLIGVALSVLLGVTKVGTAFAPFADPIIFLFLGGFLLARALEITALDQRLADLTLSSRWVNASAKRVIIAFLALAYVLSMWISNTAAMALLLPISLGVLKKLKDNFALEDEALDEKIILALAFSATIGGNATPIGSPPNVIAIGFLKNLVKIELSFLEWMAIALPLSLIIFIVLCYLVTRGLPKSELRPRIREPLSLNHFNSTQKQVMIIFFTTVFFWIAPSFVKLINTNSSFWMSFIDEALSPAIVAIFAGVALFIFPIFSKQKILAPKNLSEIDWPSLLLFGSGLSMGKMLFDTGLANLLGDMLKNATLGFPFVAIIICFIFATIFFTELVSNTASANILIPIIIALQLQLGNSSILPVMFIALASNSGFMLPVGTPPNAMAYGTKRVSKEAMARMGIILNLTCGLIFSGALLLASYFN